MAEVLVQIWLLLRASAGVLVSMAPLLLVGFVLAGLMQVLLPAAFVARHLGGAGLRPIITASALGVPLPVCSCGVIPLATTLRRRGAGPGALLSFLAATPQTSVDSILLCFFLLGPAFAIASPASALVAALVAGLLGSVLLRRHNKAAVVQAEARPETAWWRRALRHAVCTLPRDVAPSIVVGVLVAGAVHALLPPEVFAGALGSGLVGKLAVLAAAVPLYVCSNGVIPIAAALLAAGVSPGTALVLLLAGPATTAATIFAVRSLLGWRGVAIYLGTIIGMALLVGSAFDLFAVGDYMADHAGHQHDHAPSQVDLPWYGQLAALTLLMLFLRARWPGSAQSCCASSAAPAGPACCAASSAPAPESPCCVPQSEHLTGADGSLASVLPRDSASTESDEGR